MMPPRPRRYLREAAAMLVLARVAVRLVPAARLLTWAGHPPRRIKRFAASEIAWIAWAVETLSGRSWMRGHELARALAAQAMLRRRGIASRLCLGVARDGARLAAQAWVERRGKVVVGTPDAARVTRLAEFGSEPA
ncbi:MAG: lasso peptide biosynthesis B2 protein [Microvirga sp.]